MNALLRNVGCLVVLSLVASIAQAQVPSGPGDWPQWRGPQSNELSAEKGYCANGPPRVRRCFGRSTRSASVTRRSVIKDGLIVTQGDFDGVEHIICLKAGDGSTVWAVQPEPVAAALAAKIDERKETA